MPAIRPDAISNCIRLANEVRAADFAFVAEDGAIDSVLAFSGSLVNEVVDEVAPHEACVGALSSKDDFLSRPDEEFSLSPVPVVICRVVPLIKVDAVSVAILRQPPDRLLMQHLSLGRSPYRPSPRSTPSSDAATTR